MRPDHGLLHLVEASCEGRGRRIVAGSDALPFRNDPVEILWRFAVTITQNCADIAVQAEYDTVLRVDDAVDRAFAAKLNDPVPIALALRVAVATAAGMPPWGIGLAAAVALVVIGGAGGLYRAGPYGLRAGNGHLAKRSGASCVVGGAAGGDTVARAADTL